MLEYVFVRLLAECIARLVPKKFNLEYFVEMFSGNGLSRQE